jgi:hypothetical protein
MNGNWHWSGYRDGCGTGLDLKPATAINIFAQPKLLQARQRRLDHIGRVIRTERLAQNILDPDRFNHGAHGLAGDDASAGDAGRSMIFAPP